MINSVLGKRLKILRHRNVWMWQNVNYLSKQVNYLKLEITDNPRWRWFVVVHIQVVRD